MSRVQEIGFTRVMDETLRRAHLSLGYTQADIFNACATVPMHPSLLQACLIWWRPRPFMHAQVVKSLKRSEDITSVIISDANSVFIENILHHYDCRVTLSKLSCAEFCPGLLQCRVHKSGQV